MFEKLDEVEKRYKELVRLLADPRVLGNPREMQKLARERAEISKLVETYRVYKKVDEEIQESRALLLESDEEMRELAKSELQALKERQAALEQEIRVLLLQGGLAFF